MITAAATQPATKTNPVGWPERWSGGNDGPRRGAVCGAVRGRRRHLPQSWDRHEDRRRRDPEDRHSHRRGYGYYPAPIGASTPYDHGCCCQKTQPQRREEKRVPIIRPGAGVLRRGEELCPVEPRARGDGKRPPLPPDDEPEQRDAGRDLGQQADRPQRRIFEPEDAYRRQQDVDVAVVQLERNRQEDEPDQRHTPGQPDEIDD